HVVSADEPALERAFTTITRALAEPVGDPAILPTYLLAEAARADVKVVLSGEGADELFGGYPTYLGHKAAALFRRTPGRGVLRWLVNRVPSSTGKVTTEFLLKQLVAAAELPPVERHLTWFGALGPDPRTLAWANGVLDGFPADRSLNRLLWLDFVSYLPDNLLVKVDRGTMLASIEARAPYLDRAVLELVLPAPAELKVRGLTTKAILKEAARGLVPDDVIRRRKRGLSVPVARWLNEGLAALADRYLAAPRLYPDAPTARLVADRRPSRLGRAVAAGAGRPGRPVPRDPRSRDVFGRAARHPARADPVRGGRAVRVSGGVRAGAALAQLRRPGGGVGEEEAQGQ